MDNEAARRLAAEVAPLRGEAPEAVAALTPRRSEEKRRTASGATLRHEIGHLRQVIRNRPEDSDNCSCDDSWTREHTIG